MNTTQRFPNAHFAGVVLMATLSAATLLTTAGCAVTRGQESLGAYVDDTAITTAVKARFVENKEVDAAAISVETLKGTVLLSGFAKNTNEKTTAEALARKVNGVVAVRNEIVVRP
jgi:hyperosmotically inducible periplasmic protein